MVRLAGPNTIVVETEAGITDTYGFVELNVTDLAIVRAQIQVNVPAGITVFYGFVFSCDPVGRGLFFEANTSDRIGINAADPRQDIYLSGEVNCKGFAKCRFQCVSTATVTSEFVGIARLMGFSNVKQVGLIN